MEKIIYGYQLGIYETLNIEVGKSKNPNIYNNFSEYLLLTVKNAKSRGGVPPRKIYIFEERIPEIFPIIKNFISRTSVSDPQIVDIDKLKEYAKKRRTSK